MKPAYHSYACPDSPTFRTGERVQCPDWTVTLRRQNFGRHMKVHKRNNEIASILEGLEAIEGHETDEKEDGGECGYEQDAEGAPLPILRIFVFSFGNAKHSEISN